MSGSASLLETVHRLLERTYRVRSGVREIGRFVIGDEGLRRLYGAGPKQREVRTTGSVQGDGARTLVRETDQGVRACIYYPDEMIRSLEEHPPQQGLNDENVDSFATLVEELDHLIVIAERSVEAKPASLFELELHANLSKHMVLSRFLARRSPQLTDAQRRWLRHHLFDKVQFCDEDPDVRQRYRDAACWSIRLLAALSRLAVDERIQAVRHFHAGTVAQKLELIRSLE